ncbi:MAG TPA: hypothetical protein VJR68_18935 [Dyella sp.]|nr:hypothetical protein [Dyella sp.]HKT30251.1 hypothetical protein [Dyella sp.]
MAQRLHECFGIKRAVQNKLQRHVEMRGLWTVLVEKEQPVLGKRQRALVSLGRTGYDLLGMVLGERRFVLSDFVNQLLAQATLRAGDAQLAIFCAQFYAIFRQVLYQLEQLHPLPPIR